MQNIAAKLQHAKNVSVNFFLILGVCCLYCSVSLSVLKSKNCKQIFLEMFMWFSSQTTVSGLFA